MCWGQIYQHNMGTYSNTKYVILDSTEVSNIDFSKVMEDSTSTWRYNNAGNKTFVKFNGDTPDFLEGKTQHTNIEIREILQDVNNGWTPDPE